jgi:glyoxylase-like metal-dependent hydrolase (beta-lactamase superfamily II)
MRKLLLCAALLCAGAPIHAHEPVAARVLAQAAPVSRPAGPVAQASADARAAQAATPAPPDLQIVPVAPGLSMLVGSGGNVGVSVGSDGIFIVDDQFAPSAPKILQAIAGLQAGPVRFVINTHWHGDHTGGNEAMSGQGAVIVAHDNVRRRMSVPQLMRSVGREVPAAPPAALPVVTFAESVTLHLNGDEVRVVHLADGHTDGDAIVHFTRANVVHAGDLYFNGFYPFVDVSSGGTVRGLIRACDAILALANDATKIIPGHGPLSNAAELREYRAMLQTVADRVAAAIADGRSADEVVASKPTAEFDAKWGGSTFMPPSRFLQLVYTDLTREATTTKRPAR